MTTWTYSPYLDGFKRPVPEAFKDEEGDITDMVEACAEDDHFNHDGFERGDERKVYLFKDGVLHGSYVVDVDYEPVFCLRATGGDQ